jgi:hypothetical protein
MASLSANGHHVILLDAQRVVRLLAKSRSARAKGRETGGRRHAA